MNRKYIFLIAYLFSNTIHAGDDPKDRDDMKKMSSPCQTLLPQTPFNPSHDVWEDWSYEASIISSEDSNDSEKEDRHSHAEYQDEHKGDN
jgi:hypothetical protein